MSMQYKMMKLEEDLKSLMKACMKDIDLVDLMDSIDMEDNGDIDKLKILGGCLKAYKDVMDFYNEFAETMDAMNERLMRIETMLDNKV